MLGIFRTLHGRLLLVLLALLIPLSALFIRGTLTTAQRYYQEITQQINRDLASTILQAEPNLMVDGSVDTDKFDKSAKALAMTNPGVEVYILGLDGHIIGSSVDMEELETDTVDTGPVLTFLNTNHAFPLLGTDPRQLGNMKIFSVAPLLEEDGYVYVLLADTTGDSVIRSTQGSTVLRLGLWSSALALLLFLGVGTLAFSLLTRRLRELENAMTSFREHDFVVDEPLLIKPTRSRDEIDNLQLGFAEMSERISEQVQSLRQMDSLRRELITNVSHDLRTPLTALQGYLETLQRKETTLTHEERRYLESARSHAEGLGRLISDLFELSKLDARAIDPEFEAFPMQELAQDVAQKFQLTAEQKRISLTVATPEYLPFVYADIGLIERVLTNLTDNAVRHTPAGGSVCIQLEHVQLGPGTGAVRVEVIDDGEGVAPEAIDNIFDRFYRASSQDTGGTGLGLAITKRIIELHESEISVRSTVGRGSTFTFHLATVGDSVPNVSLRSASRPPAKRLTKVS